jgi:phosphatidate phosphatase APP1
MADLYRRIAGSPDRSERDAKRPERRSVAFHYVSLSPWQLAPLIDEFLAENAFPGGSLHLQAFRLQDGDLGDLLGDSREKKLAAIEPLLARWPRRKFVLIGDSGQCDPEAYGELARRHPQQIERVWIRETTSRADARYDAAFTGVPRERWQLFADPAKLALPEGE